MKSSNFGLTNEIKPSLGNLVCFSHLRWDFVYQRPQHLLSRAARDYRVWYFEEPIFVAGAQPRLDIRRSVEDVHVVVPVLSGPTEPASTDPVLTKLIDEFVAALLTGPITLWYYTPMALPFTRQIEPAVCVFDNMDELSTFMAAPPKMAALERELLSRADIVFTGGQSLFESKRGRHANVHAFPSSVDKAHFAASRLMPANCEPPDQRSLTRPRIGFFGVIDERLDLDLLDQAACMRPDWSFAVIGPVVKNPGSLPVRPNLHWLGSKRYQNLPSYLSGWDVGIMPFALNEATRFISPTKTPEFLAAGVPVVSTAIVDVVRPYGELGLVEIASSPGDFVSKIDKCLARSRQPWLRDVDRFLAELSWDRTWGEMRSLIKGVGGKQTPLKSIATAGEPTHV